MRALDGHQRDGCSKWSYTLMLKITIFMMIITMHQVSICFFLKKKNIYFVVPGLHCSIWDLWLWLAESSSLTRDWPGPPALGTWSLSHWITREVPLFAPCFAFKKISRKRPESGLLGKHLGGFWAKLWEVWFYEESRKREMSNQNANGEGPRGRERF